MRTVEKLVFEVYALSLITVSCLEINKENGMNKPPQF
jgi:hypothetical protein